MVNFYFSGKKFMPENARILYCQKIARNFIKNKKYNKKIINYK